MNSFGHVLRPKLARWLGAETTAAQSLGVFRMGIAALCLLQLWLVGDHLLLLYGNTGIMQWVISETVKSPYLPSVALLTDYLQPLGLAGDQCVDWLVGLYMFCLMALLVGWQTRVVAMGAWLCQLAFCTSGSFALYGADTMLNLALFHCVWMPVGAAYSVDTYGSAHQHASPAYCQLALTVLRIHLCIIYLNTGSIKLTGEQWWNGEAIWRSVMQPQFHQFDWTWLAQVPWLAKLMGWITLLIETGYACLIWPGRTRPIWLLATVLLHLGIGLFLGLWLFALIMIVLSVTAFGWPYVLKLATRVRTLRWRRVITQAQATD